MNFLNFLISYDNIGQAVYSLQVPNWYLFLWNYYLLKHYFSWMMKHDWYYPFLSVSILDSFFLSSPIFRRIFNFDQNLSQVLTNTLGTLKSYMHLCCFAYWYYIFVQLFIFSLHTFVILIYFGNLDLFMLWFPQNLGFFINIMVSFDHYFAYFK